MALSFLLNNVYSHFLIDSSKVDSNSVNMLIFNVADLKEKWLDFVKEPFPKIIDTDLKCELIYLDSLIAGCVDTFIQTGELDEDKKKVLSDCLADLKTKSKEVDESSEDHFKKLVEIAEEVLRTLSNL